MHIIDNSNLGRIDKLMQLIVVDLNSLQLNQEKFDYTFFNISCRSNDNFACHIRVQTCNNIPQINEEIFKKSFCKVFNLDEIKVEVKKIIDELWDYYQYNIEISDYNYNFFVSEFQDIIINMRKSETTGLKVFLKDGLEFFYPKSDIIFSDMEQDDDAWIHTYRDTGLAKQALMLSDIDRFEII